MRRVLLTLAVPVVLAAGCGAGAARPVDRAGLDGVYRRTSGRATWTVAFAGRRFAVMRRDDRGCAWAYGGLTRLGPRVELRAVDAGGPASGAAMARPADALALAWNLYRDVLQLRALTAGPAVTLAEGAWRQAPRADAWRARGCGVPTAALTPTGVEDVRPTGAVLGFSGDFARTAPARWVGHGSSDQLGRGRMTLDGPVAFERDSRTRLTFTLRFRGGVLRGCAITAILRRPHRRFVWDGPGQITATSPGLRRYLALSGGIGGVTYFGARDRMHGGFGSYPGARPRGRLRPDVVC